MEAIFFSSISPRNDRSLRSIRWRTIAASSFCSAVSLLAGFGALAGELLGVTRVIDLAIFLQARQHKLNKEFVVAPPLQFLLHFVHRMRPPHQRPHRDIVQLRFRFKFASFPEHGGSIEEKVPSG